MFSSNLRSQIKRDLSINIVTVVYLCFFIFYPKPILGQNIDLLKKELQGTSVPSDKILLQDSIISQLLFTSQDEALLYTHLMIKEAESIPDTAALARAYRYLGIALVQKGKRAEALLHFKHSLALIEQSDNADHTKAITYNNLGLLSIEMNHYPEALSYLRQSLDLKKNENNPKGVAITLNNIGLCYYRMEDYEKGLDYFVEALNIRKENNLLGDAISSYINIAGIYHWLEEYETSLENYNTAEALLDTSMTVSMKRLSIYAGKGESYLRNEQVDRAEKSISKALEIANQLEHQEEISRMWNLLAQVSRQKNDYLAASKFCQKAIAVDDTSFIAGESYMLLGDIWSKPQPSKAERAYLRAAAIANSLTQVQLTMKVHKKLSDLYIDQKRYQLAYNHLLEHQAAQDKLFNQQSLNRLKELQFRYESQEKELEISRLREKELNQQQSLQKQKAWIWALILVSLLTILAAIMWITKNKKISRQAKKIQEQDKRLLEQENRHALEKINTQNKELTSKAMFILETSEKIDKTSSKLAVYKRFLRPDMLSDFVKDLAELQQVQDPDRWRAFEKYFLETHESFYKNLEKRFPNLTTSEKKLCAFLRLNLNTKEIATLLNLSPKSIEVSRSRLRKKLHLDDRSISLSGFLSDF